jgi:hypothetical protein
MASLLGNQAAARMERVVTPANAHRSITARPRGAGGPSISTALTRLVGSRVGATSAILDVGSQTDLNQAIATIDAAASGGFRIVSTSLEAQS